MSYSISVLPRCKPLTSVRRPKSPQLNESLRTALAGVNAKLSELRTENTVLQGASARAKELAAEKASVVKQHAALQTVSRAVSCSSPLADLAFLRQDLKRAQSEIKSLESELATERNRVKTLANEQSLSAGRKGALEARLAAAESVSPIQLDLGDLH